MKLRPECIFVNFYERNRMTEEIRKQILAIRDTGRTNMFDVPTVQQIACEMELYELVVFLEEHPAEYTQFILTGKTAP